MTSLHTLEAYELEGPTWRPPLLLTRFGHEAAYPELFPGTTALYPQAGGHATHSHVPGGPPAGTASTAATPAKEDDLSEAVVKNGFVNKAVIQGETASIYPFIQEKLTKGPTIPIISSLVAAVLERKHLDPTAGGTTASGSLNTSGKPIIIPNPRPWTYKAPSRVVYNATRLESWYSELANPAVPLSRLSKNIPNNPSSSTVSSSTSAAGTGIYGGTSSTARGSDKPIDKNLDMLLNRNVPLERAIWFLRSTGMTEIQQMSKASLKSSASSSAHFSANNPAHVYTIEFTNSVIELLKRQLAEIVLPLVHHANLAAGLGARPGMSLKGKARNIMAEDQPRERWLARWTWSSDLVRRLFEGGLLDKNRWMTGLLETLRGCHLVQVEWWLSLLHDTVLEDLLDIRWMAKDLVRMSLKWLGELESPSSVEYATYDEDLVVSTTTCVVEILQKAWQRHTEAFYQPRFWLGGGGKKDRLQALVVKKDRDAQTWRKLEGRARRILCENPEPFSQIWAASNVGPYENERPPLASKMERQQPQPKFDGPEISSTLKVIALLDDFSTFDKVQELYQNIFEGASVTGFKAPPLTPTAGLHPSKPYTPMASATPERQRLEVILNWAITPMRYGEHRKYLAVSLVTKYAESGTSLSTTSQMEHAGGETDEHGRRKCIWQDAFQVWLDSLAMLEYSGSEGIVRKKAVELSVLLAEAQLLDVARLLQVAISRGMEPIGQGEEEHISFQVLAQLPWQNEPLAMQAQLRRVFRRHMASTEDADERIAGIKQKLKDEILEPDMAGSPSPQALRNIFDLTPQPNDDDIMMLSETAEELEELDPKQRRTILRDWLLPKAMAKTSWSLVALGRILDLYESASDFSSLFALLTYYLSNDILDDSVTLEVLLPMVFARMLIWTSMASLRTLAEVLWRTHAVILGRDKSSTALLGELTMLGQAGYLPQSMYSDLALIVSSLQRQIYQYPPPLSSSQRLDILPMATLKEAEQSASDFCHQRRGQLDLPDLVVNAIMAAAQTPFHVAEHLGHFYRTIQEQVPGGLESALTNWLDGLADQDPMVDSTLGNISIKSLIPFLRSVVLAGTVSCTTLIRSLLLPQSQLYLHVETQDETGDIIVDVLKVLSDVLLGDCTGVQDVPGTAAHKRLQRIHLCDPERLSLCLQLLALLARLESTANSEGEGRLASTARCLLDGIKASEEFQIAVICNRAVVSNFYLQHTVADDATARLANIEVFAEILASFKSTPGQASELEYSESRRRTRSPSKPATSSTGPIPAVDGAVFLADVKRLEIEVYLKRMRLREELNSDDPWQQADPNTEESFARGFLENMLAAPASESGTLQGLAHLTAFTGSAAKQLVQAAFVLGTEDLDAHSTDAESDVFERIGALVSILRKLLSSMEPFDFASSDNPVPVPNFLGKWMRTTSDIVMDTAPLQSKPVHAFTLIELLCVSMRFSDIWAGHQEELLDTLRIVCVFLHKQQAIPCDVQGILVDVVSYLLDSASDRARMQACQSLAQTAARLSALPDSHLHALSVAGLGSTMLVTKHGDVDYISPSKPWEIHDPLDMPAGSAREAASSNAGSIDLGKLQAQTREMATAPLPGDPSASLVTALAEFGVGRQANFAFEMPMMQESLWQSDFRRSCNAHLELPSAQSISIHDEVIAMPGRKESHRTGGDPADSVEPTLAVRTASTSSDTAAKRPANKKRKSVPEISIEEEPKRKKAASKSTKKK